MSHPSRRLIAVKKEIFSTPQASNANEVSHKEQQCAVQEDDTYHLSDKPFFDVVFSRSHVEPPYTLYIPTNFIPKLPRANSHVVLKHSGKSWNMSYIGDSTRPRFGPKWKTFVTENHLKVADACVFELVDPTSTNLVLKVHILRGDTPPELLSLVDHRGETSNTPIVID